jgi:dihydrofolate synthase/folylpolyglutamate synthase
VRGWSERIRIGNAEADFERSLAGVRPRATALRATQFEALTAAALLAFADAGVDVAVVEAGLGGRHDATNVLQSRVVVLTNVALDHMDVLGDTREAIAAEKLAVVRPGVTVVLAEPEWQTLAEENGAAKVVLTAPSNLALAIAAAEAFLGEAAFIEAGSAADVMLPGRLERRSERPLEIWDGAHNLAAVAYLLPRVPDREYVLVSSILVDKRPELMLEALSVLGGTLVATQSSNTRSLPAGELAARAKRYFDYVETVVDPAEARRRALALAGPDGAVLVSGSLYLLTDLSGPL